MKPSLLSGARRADPDAPPRLSIGVGLVTIVWLIAIGRWIWCDTTVPWDSKNQFFAFFRFLAESLHAGTTVFWNPYHYGGHPSIADPQSLVFSPPFLLWAWFDRTPSIRSFDLIVMAHLLAGGLAILGLGRRRSWTTAAGVLAATVFMLGGAASARLNHTGIITSYGLFPVALLALEHALGRRSLLLGAGFAVLAATIALGRNQVALMLCLLLIAAFLHEVLDSGRPLQFVRERLALIALILIVGVALTAVPVILSLQLAGLSNRPAVTLAVALEASLHPTSLASLAVPNIFGSHAPNFGYWGPHYSIIPEVGATDDSSNYLYVGTVSMVVLLWLGLASGKLMRPGYRMLSGLLGLSLLFALGRYTPLFPLVFEHLPGFSFFRRPTDGVFIAGIMIALLSGQLLSDYVRIGPARAQPLLLWACIVGIIVILGGALVVSGMTGHAWQAVAEILKVVPIAGLAIALLMAARDRRQRSITATVLALAAAAELLIWNAASRMNSEASAYYRVLEQASTEDSEALRLLSLEMKRRNLEGSRPRVEIVGVDGPWQNLSVVRGLEATNGYNPLRIGIYDRFVAPGEEASAIDKRRFPPTFAGYDCALARAMGLEYLVLDRPIEQYRHLQYPERLQILLAGPKTWIYRIHGAMPRVKFSSRIQVADVDATLLNGELRHPPSDDRIIIDDETPPTRSHSAVANPNAAGKAHIISWRPGRIEIEVETSHAGVLVLHDLYYPGWIAEIDGQRAPILRAEVLFRAVEVAAGRHTVVFSFEPLSLDNLTRALRQISRRT